MSTPDGSPERDSPPRLDYPSSPSGLDPDPPSTGSPLLSPDSSSHDAALSAPAVSPADSESLSPDELELLAKLEEQNRLLEADSKSMRSMSGSRRNSGSSLVSSSSASSNLSHLEEDTWILWGRIVNEWEEWRRKKDKLLKELIRKGIPHHFRAIVWQLLGNATDMPVKNQYSELLKMSSPCEKLIRRDIARTYPEHEFFKGQDSLGQEVLFNVMKGSAFIVGLLLMQMPEEEAFCVFVRLMQEYRLRELFKPSMAELGLCIYQFEYLLQEQLPELNVHFRSQSFHTSMYASSWFLTLFLTFLPLPIATRIFDIFMYEGLEIIFRVGMAILQYNQTDLIQLDMEGMSQHFQKVIPHQFDSCPDKLILRAYQVKYNPKRMKKLEKEGYRIETLEKGQVTRAQEAEENYVIKRELAVVRQQCSVASESLEKAQDTIRELQQQKYTDTFVTNLQTQLEQSRLQEAELLGALKEMQDKVLDLEKHHMEVKLKALQLDSQNQIHSKLIGRNEQERSALQDRLQMLANQNKGLQTQLSEMKRKQAEFDCKSKEEVMAVRLREADSMAAKEEGLIQGQLNNSDSRQYISQLRDQITELKNEVRQLRGHKLVAPCSGGVGSTNYLHHHHRHHHHCQDPAGPASPAEAEGDFLSSDDELLASPVPPDALFPPLPSAHDPRALDSEGSTDSEAEEEEEERCSRTSGAIATTTVATAAQQQHMYGTRMCATEALDN
ncbi:hypothetical protein NHX12_018588 [Muraenolepis orangiensis]|uniref:Rab-GAP TBC domain-containing protein n=1 Tax=Muraenolepis orangiensis TaxID=630683 RepID=A0A9Q0EZD8_9TELE|nr:hypothetical protein NHX12_018588 [Muraenolepis orangiensis]